jgi:NhaA family Na+:H+ antiporter
MRAHDAIWTSVYRFTHTEAFGGALLLFATVIALAWANSPWAASYAEVWHTHIRVGIGSHEINHSAVEWINDGLMCVFFFLVGLEIKREMLTGELASARRAAFPIAAAIGGMVVPAAIFASLNHGGGGAAGWGIPMATDIAFSLGLLALLGSRVPVALKVFLAALAIVDDLGAVLVIAVFYTDSISWSSLTCGLVLLGVSAALGRMGVRRPIVYALLGVLVWLTFLGSGVHATIAGVLLAFTIPARRKIDTVQFIRDGRAIIDTFEQVDDPLPLTNEPQRALIRDLEARCEAVEPPLQRIEHALHPWVAYGIMPLFALANAGLVIDGGFAHGLAQPIGLGVLLGLVVGKPLGILAATWLAVRLGMASRPEGVSMPQLVGVGILAGIGFTMSLFITNLAYSDDALRAAAKAAIMTASLISAVLGLMVLHMCLGTRSGRAPMAS